MNKKFLASILSLTIFFAFAVTLHANQHTTGGTSNPPTGTTSNPPTGTTQNIGISIPNPLSAGDSLYELLATIINEILLPIGGILAVLAFIYSGFLYVTAQGNEKKIETAHRALLYSAIGTAVLLGAWMIAQVICGTIEQLGAPACGI